ncbi:MAG TPA: DJ-1/PfpI family protein [Allosphingosinicella sp.]|nr:DJ-1/PfpI family protein [Allosphingosinicella sp.]
MEPVSVAFLLFPNVTQLDLTGPAQVLSRLGRQTLHFVWKDLRPVPTDAGFSILPTATFADIAQADIICIPGGIGVADVMEDEEALAWVRRVGGSATWVTSVCTGSLILGAAGLLRGYRAATHWAWREYLPLFGAEAAKERVVFDRNRVTGGGVTAGIDFALALTAAIRGEAHAKAVQLSLEYDPAPPFCAGSPEGAGETLVANLRARMDQLAPDRAERIRAAAARLSRADPAALPRPCGG